MNTKFALQVLCLICFMQIFFTIYLIVKIYASSVVRPNHDEPAIVQEKVVFESKISDIQIDPVDTPKDNYPSINLNLGKGKIPTITVLGKAAIASYFWEHIFEGVRVSDQELPGILSGQINFPNVTIKYIEGPALVPTIFPHTSERVILIGNGRTKEKVKSVMQWLHSFNAWHHRPDVLLILLGNEKCENKWLLEFLPPNGSLRGVFLTYDDPLIDNKVFFQWPLGVATYRHFPTLKEQQLEVDKDRRYICNIQATNYSNSTRSLLFQILESNALAKRHCYVGKRISWQSTESPESMNDYIWYMIQSDLTLCPSGFNSETYRVYEAMATGSIPVIEDAPSGGSCDVLGWRLLKEFDPPVIWIKNWNELPSLLEKETKKSLKEKVDRRKEVIKWYSWFKDKMKQRTLSFMHEKLLNPD